MAVLALELQVLRRSTSDVRRKGKDREAENHLGCDNSQNNCDDRASGYVVNPRIDHIADADSADFASSGNGVAGERHWGPGISLATAGANRKGSCVLPNYRRVWGLVGG